MNQAWVALLLFVSCLSIPRTAAASGPRLLVALDPAQQQLPESVTVSPRDGTVFMSLSLSRTVAAFDIHSGQLNVIAQLPIPSGASVAGLKLGRDGRLYAVTTSTSAAPPAAFIFRIDSNGAVEQFAALDPHGFPNDLAFDDYGNLYVTDSLLGLVYQLDSRGNARVWSGDPRLAGNPADPAFGSQPFGADGIAFDAGERNLFVGNFDDGAIVRIPLRADGSAGPAATFVADARLRGLDGIAFDDVGNLYLAVNVQDRLAVADRRGNLTVLAEGGLLDAPSSVAFGATRGAATSLYITSFAVNRFLGTQPGAPHPALLRLDVGHLGLPLP